MYIFIYMKRRQRGFGALEGLLILVIVGLLVFVGWYVWNSKKSTDKTYNESSSVSGVSTNKASVSKVDINIHDVDISLKTASDISKLPSYTPASFKTFLTAKLQSNTPDSNGCITLFKLSKISQFNISGGQSSADSAGNAGTDNCLSGAPVVWVVTPKGTWDEVSLNGPLCISQNGGKVYQEFTAKCYTDSNAESSITNPNGSITSLKQ